MAYQMSRNLMSFYIAGFQYWDGAMALDALRAGVELELVPEPDNPHDEHAVAIFHNGIKLGYIPAELNDMISPLLVFGHASIFCAVVQQVSPERSPWHQVRVGIFVADARQAVQG